MLNCFNFLYVPAGTGVPRLQPLTETALVMAADTGPDPPKVGLQGYERTAQAAGNAHNLTLITGTLIAGNN